ncbi:hypothetical protein [Bacillus sp. CGMCC 1.16541]|uniref:hypothetical protein n=1 Tax=Bacillus sp. CGMCC 1.16541 TaxID=2185143 RepID=UPI000D734B39|nr:hypothetical protein [Bacillus sp. CGMCC 1.16541]
MIADFLYSMGVRGLDDLPITIGLLIIVPWNFVLCIIHFFKEGNEGNLFVRLLAFLMFVLMYGKQAFMSLLGFYLLGVGLFIFSTESIISWIFAAAFMACGGGVIYQSYPRYIEIGNEKKKSSKKAHKKRVN